ncbi:LolA-related protein [Povalibacter sp.]|uniref:LolA-related protein n=1 Tax=Povalibacter sp. TaxID=1962978 RepID=UPI002F3FDE6B
MLAATLPGLLPAATPPENDDARALIATLARPAPATIDFTEIRFSALLKQPIIVSGQLAYSGPDALDRRVTQPYREDTEIRGNAVRVRREGEPERNFAIKRAPELQLLLRTFTAMLQGDAAAIEKNFSLAATSDPIRWQLVLTPQDARLARRVQHIRIDGRSDLPRCLSIVNDARGASIMLLGAATHVQMPPVVTREWLERTCSAGE